MEEIKWKEVHINFAPFKGEKQSYWVVGYNDGGIGTPLFSVDKDVEYFTYSGDDHNFAQESWQTVVARNIAFYRKYLTE